jgi:NAD(P)H-flavin reductase
MAANNRHLHLPKPARIIEVIVENSQIKTFVLSFPASEPQRGYSYRPGQFMMVSVVHCGEAPISISSTPTRPGRLELSVRRAGKLTTALHNCEPGDIIGLRGPYGRSFPVEELVTLDLLFVAGGIGLAPLRSVINHCLDQGHGGRMEILYGSRSPEDIAFKNDLNDWSGLDNVSCRLTVDQRSGDWQGPVGVVTALLPAIELDPQNGAALVCGPPMMISAVMARLAGMGFSDERIITTMERHMKCGTGTCGHCHLGGRRVCTEGPVFTRGELLELDVMGLAQGN